MPSDLADTTEVDIDAEIREHAEFMAEQLTWEIESLREVLAEHAEDCDCNYSIRLEIGALDGARMYFERLAKDLSASEEPQQPSQQSAH
jgi:hypothetical protein